MKTTIITKIVIVLVLTLAISLQISNAQTYGEAFHDALTKINNFFENEQYKEYAKTIDFVFFALLFTAIYMIGVKYAFKEVNRAVKVIAIVLGLMSAFLMVSQGKSIIFLLPYVDYLLYVLLFIVFWLLLKNIESKFWRFIVALALTLIVVVLVQGVFAEDSEYFVIAFSYRKFLQKLKLK